MGLGRDVYIWPKVPSTIIVHTLNRRSGHSSPFAAQAVDTEVLGALVYLINGVAYVRPRRGGCRSVYKACQK